MISHHSVTALVQGPSSEGWGRPANEAHRTQGREKLFSLQTYMHTFEHSNPHRLGMHAHFSQPVKNNSGLTRDAFTEVCSKQE